MLLLLLIEIKLISKYFVFDLMKLQQIINYQHGQLIIVDKSSSQIFKNIKTIKYFVLPLYTNESAMENVVYLRGE
jgi:hypothetical protein